jgi:hypothetical protein
MTALSLPYQVVQYPEIIVILREAGPILCDGAG